MTVVYRRLGLECSLDGIRPQPNESRFYFATNQDPIWVVMITVYVWGGPRGEHLNPAFDLKRYTTLTAGVMEWGTITYETRSPLILIDDTLTSQRMFGTECVALEPNVLPLLTGLPAGIL